MISTWDLPQTPWEQSASVKRWLENSGPLYEDREVTVTVEMDEIMDLSLSYASELIYFGAEIGSTITVKVRVR